MKASIAVVATRTLATGRAEPRTSDGEAESGVMRALCRGTRFWSNVFGPAPADLRQQQTRSAAVAHDHHETSWERRGSMALKSPQALPHLRGRARGVRARWLKTRKSRF